MVWSTRHAEGKELPQISLKENGCSSLRGHVLVMKNSMASARLTASQVLVKQHAPHSKQQRKSARHSVQFPPCLPFG